MTRTLFIFLALSSFTIHAQTRYALRQIDFQDRANSDIVKSNSDNLAVILADAYLNGKLEAYTIGPLDSLIQSLEFPKRSLRESEVPAKKRADRKKVFAKIPFGKPKAGVKVSPADLKPLTKSEFLKQMVIFEDEIVQWDKSTRYERGKGLVYHKGLGYFPKKDTVGIPPPNKAYWELAYNASIPFYFRVQDLPAVSVFGQYVTVDRKEEWQPLLIRITRTQEVPDYLVDMTVSFKYDEVMKYLASIGQTLLYKEPTGFVGGGAFVLGDDEREYLREKFRSEAVTNSTFKSNVKVNSLVVFSAFLDKSEKEPLTLFQDPSGKEFRMYRQNIQAAVVSTGAVEQMLNFPKVEMITWSQALSQDMLKHYEIKLNGMTCELPYAAVSPTESNPTPRQSFFLEKYTVSTVGAAEQKRLRSRFTNLIKVVNAQFKAGTLLLAEEKDSWFRAKYDWSTLPEIKAKGTGVNKAYWSNLLHHDDISDVRYPYYWSENSNVSYLHKKLSPFRVDSLEFGVTYKRVVPVVKGGIIQQTTTKPAKPAFEPYQVSLRSLREPGMDGNDLPTYTFNWSDLRKVLVKGKDPLLIELVKLIETGDLPFTDSRIIYGAIEDAPAPAPKPVAVKK